MKVKAVNSLLGSALYGHFIDYGQDVIFTYYVEFPDDSRKRGKIILGDVSELADYLLNDCGYDFLLFKK